MIVELLPELFGLRHLIVVLDQQFTGAQASLILLHAHLDLFKHLSDWGVDRRCRLGAVFVFLIVATLALLQSWDGRLFILMVGNQADFNMLRRPTFQNDS